MSKLREILEDLKGAIAAQRAVSRFMCEGCELRDRCSLPAHRRQLCWEARALRPQP
jgi:hypothetical protein